MPSNITALCTMARGHHEIYVTATCSKLLKRCSPFMAQNPKRSFGLTILTSGMRLRPRCFPAANTILGHLCRKEFGTLAYTIGFGTKFRLTVAAASNWDGPMEIKRVVPAVAESYRPDLP